MKYHGLKKQNENLIEMIHSQTMNCNKGNKLKSTKTQQYIVNNY